MIGDTEFVIDDEKDILNDETFGDDGAEYPWDDADNSEHPFDFGINTGLDTDNSNRIQNSSNEPVLRVDLAYAEYEDQDSGYTNVEESISRLVLEDDDIEDERDKIIKASHRSLMPPQVITRNLTWFTEKDSESSFFSSSIWSMHPTEVLQGTSQAQQRNLPVQEQPAVYRPPPGLEEKRSTMRTLQDIEDEMHFSSVSKEATSSESAVEPRASLSMHNANITNQMGINQPQYAYGRGVHGRMTRPPPGIQNQPPMHDLRRMTFPFDNSGQPWQDPSIKEYSSIPPAVSYGRGRAIINNERPDFILGQRLGMPPGMRPPHHPHASMSMTRGVPKQPQQYFRFRPNMDFMGKRNQGNSRRSQFQSADYLDAEKHAGLMNEQDKQRLRNIQILQLQGDHPYTTDYYYQMQAYRKDGDIKHLKKLFPHKDERAKKNKYTPTRFENALGKLQTVSALAPKRVMDTVLKVSMQSTHGRNSRSALWQDIERAYILYLNCREFSFRRLAHTLYDENDPLPEFLAHTKILRVFDLQTNNIFRWLVCRKGRGLFMKLIPQFLDYGKGQGQEASYMILANMLKYSTVRSMRRMESNPGFREFCELIDDMIKFANHFLIDLLLQSFHIDLWRTCFGCTVGMLLLDRAAEFEDCLRTCDWTPYPASVRHGLSDLRISTTDYLPGFARFPSVLGLFLEFNLLEFGTPLNIISVAPNFLETFMKKDSCPLKKKAGAMALIWVELKRRSLSYQLAECDSE